MQRKVKTDEAKLPKSLEHRQNFIKTLKDPFTFFDYRPEVGKTRSHYKLRINLEQKYFEQHKEVIVDILKDLIGKFPKAVPQFKYYNSSDNQLLERDFWQALLNKDYDTASRCRIQITDPEIVKELWHHQEKSRLTSDYTDTVLINYLQQAEAELQAALRLKGAGQFTLYLDKDFDEYQVQRFVYDLDLRLQQVKAIPGSIVNTDLPLTQFIGIRQERLNWTRTYIWGHTISDAQLAKLKSQLRSCSLYKALTCEEYRKIPTPEEKSQHGFNPPEELITAINAEISRFKIKRSVFTKGMGDKSQKIKDALNRASAALDHMRSMDDFVRYRQNGLPSIYDALQIARKTDVPEKTKSWERVEQIMLTCTASVKEFKA